MSKDLDALTEALARHVSRVNARALLLRALRDNNVRETKVTRDELRRCSNSIRQGIEFFVSPGNQPAAFKELSTFFEAGVAIEERCAVAVRTEADVGTARSEARRLCDRFGTDPFTMQKVTTIVSELARNIVLYADTGTIEMRSANQNGRRICIRAVDQGPGIPNVDHVLSGTYKSKTGLGRGLAGTKRLADRFDITTGGRGTEVLVEVAL